MVADFDEKKQQVLRNDGKPYTVSPYTLIWNGDYYYLVGCYHEKKRMTVFRVDRILTQPVVLDVYNEASRSMQKNGWLPGLFRGIIQKAKEILQVLIRETEVPAKPTLSVDMAKYRTMQKLMVKVQDEARAIKQLVHGELPKLEKQLAETTGLFKGKDRKALQEKIAGVQQEIDRRMDRLPGILKEDGYPDV